jgi:8-oxo-dGTP pyrophosphatase MutT (NUDIX family)
MERITTSSDPASDLANSSQTTQPFVTHPSLNPFTVNHATFLKQTPLSTSTSTPLPIQHIATGAILIHPSPSSFSPSQTQPQPQPPRVLLLRRAPTDSMPNLWEVPGGAVDLTDTTILTGVARELYEESHLSPTSIGPLVGPSTGQVFASRSGKLIAKFHFLVEVADDQLGEVRCDPAEHSQWVWAEEGEVEKGEVRGMELRFTTREQREVVLEGFRVWRELRRGKGVGEEEGNKDR